MADDHYDFPNDGEVQRAILAADNAAKEDGETLWGWVSKAIAERIAAQDQYSAGFMVGWLMEPGLTRALAPHTGDEARLLLWLFNRDDLPIVAELPGQLGLDWAVTMAALSALEAAAFVRREAVDGTAYVAATDEGTKEAARLMMTISAWSIGSMSVGDRSKLH